jgi:hypothetical protein
MDHVDPGSTVNVHAKITRPDTPPSGDPTTIATHRVKTDYENGRSDRPELPMVFVWDERKVILTKEWQMYYVAINFNMVVNNISRSWDDNVAFTNNTGFNGTTHARNYIMMQDLNNDLPKYDKTRTCGDALHNMKVVPMTAHIAEVMGYTNIANAPAEVYSILCMNGTSNPLLKPGFTHPQSTEEAYGAFDRYLYNPRDNPMLFFASTVTGNDFHSHAWPMKAGTGMYPWYKNGTTPVLWQFVLAPGGECYFPPKQRSGNTPYLETL